MQLLNMQIRSDLNTGHRTLKKRKQRFCKVHIRRSKLVSFIGRRVYGTGKTAPVLQPAHTTVKLAGQSRVAKDRLRR